MIIFGRGRGSICRILTLEMEGIVKSRALIVGRRIRGKMITSLSFITIRRGGRWINIVIIGMVVVVVVIDISTIGIISIGEWVSIIRTRI